MKQLSSERFAINDTNAVHAMEDDDEPTPSHFHKKTLPDDEHHYGGIRVVVHEVQTGSPRLTAYTYDEEPHLVDDSDWNEQYQFTVTSMDAPKTCSYRWNNGDLPTAVARAVYEHGYAIENAQTIPEYTSELTILREVERVLKQKQDELSALDVPLVPDLLEAVRELVTASNRILRCRLATTDEEWELICRNALDDVFDGHSEAIEINDREEVFDLARYTYAYTRAVLDETREDGEAPDGVRDPETIEREVQYGTRVTVRDDRFIYVDLTNRKNIERFVFEKTGDDMAVAQRYFGVPPHAQAIRAVNEKTDFTVQGHPSITRWPDNPHDLLATLISTLESLGDTHDGPWYAGASILMAADMAYDLQMVYAFADALGRERTRELCDEIGMTGDLTSDATEFVNALPPEEADQLRAEHEFLDRALDDYQYARERGPIYSDGSPMP